jgi:carbamate kinase
VNTPPFSTPSDYPSTLKIVVALGGNALVGENQKGTYEEMVSNVRTACSQMMRIIDTGHQLVITHGNGPQVGNLALQQTSASGVPEMPLHVLGSMTQGEIGYMLQRELGNVLRSAGSKRPVVSLVTQVLVDKGDPAFKDPTKPVGPFYSEEEADNASMSKGFVIKRVGSGARPYRRVVPSPEPVSVVEAESVSKMLGTGAIAVASGGGGIPVIRSKNGEYVGVDAVIDKDLSAEKLAEGIRADVLLILTGVDKAKRNFGRKGEKGIDSMTASEARNLMKEGQFPPGTMGPKVTACIRFVEWGGKPAIITSLERAVEALERSAGTRVVPD